MRIDYPNYNSAEGKKRFDDIKTFAMHYGLSIDTRIPTSVLIYYDAEQPPFSVNLYYSDPKEFLSKIVRETFARGEYRGQTEIKKNVRTKIKDFMELVEFGSDEE
jgi:hypothetical protein